MTSRPQQSAWDWRLEAPDEVRPASRAYAIAVVAWAAGLLLRTALDGLFDSRPFFTPFYPSILVAAWYGGLGPGLLAVGLTVPSGGLLWLQSGAAPEGGVRWLYILGAAGSMTAIVWVADLLHRSRLGVQSRSRERAAQVEAFLALFVHELRHPLGAIRHAVDALRAAGPSLSLQSQRWVDVIERQARQLELLTGELLDPDRREGALACRHAPLDLRDAVREAIDTAGPRIEARRHALDLHLPSGPVRVRGDLPRLVQAVTNLLINAAEYTEPGGRISLDLFAGERAVVQVRDTGRGIDRRELGRVFDPFERLDPVGPGMGIGLAVVRKIVEAHRGSVEARSDGIGRGSEFRIELPLAAGSAATGPAAGSPRRVLVVEDNPDAAEALSLLLAKDGHEVRVAHDGETALTLAEAFRPQAVVLDLGLPDLSGADVARRLARSRANGPRIRLVAVTGSNSPPEGADGQLFDAYLVKPVGREALTTALSDGDGA